MCFANPWGQAMLSVAARAARSRSSTSPQRLRGIERKWRLMPPLSAYVAPRHVGMRAPDARGSAAALPLTEALNKLAQVCHTRRLRVSLLTQHAFSSERSTLPFVHRFTLE